MSVADHCKSRYQTGDTPWDIGRPDHNLIEVVTATPISTCRTLEIGCGTGDNSIWLARNGFQVIGIDSSPIAIDKANTKVSQTKLDCQFRCADFFLDTLEGGPFQFVFDKGCFHLFGSEMDRRHFAQTVAAHLQENGWWLSLIGNADEDRQGPGPPQRTASEIVRAVEPDFRILALTVSHFESDRPVPPRAWRCLMQRRN